MKGKEILEAVNAEILNLNNDESLQNEYSFGFATDLMSDALALIQSDEAKTVLITGLANMQSINTADMLDINLVLLVRGKYLSEEVISHAKSHNINLFKTNCSMYEVCGILFEKGLGAIDVNCLS